MKIESNIFLVQLNKLYQCVIILFQELLVDKEMTKIVASAVLENCLESIDSGNSNNFLPANVSEVLSFDSSSKQTIMDIGIGAQPIAN